MTANTADRMQLAADIASSLGDGWQSVFGDNAYHDDAQLHGPDGEQGHLRWDGYATKGRVAISGSLDNELYQHKPYNAKVPSITVAEAKSAVQIARDIERRLLSDYRALLATVRASKAASDKAEAERSELLELLPSVLGPGTERWTHNRRDELHIGKYGDQIHGSVEATYGGEAKFEIRTSSREAAQALATAIAATRREKEEIDA